MASRVPRAKITRIADWGTADWSLRDGDFATSDPLEARVRGQIWNLSGKWLKLGTNCGAVPGPAQFKFRTLEAVLR
eukprot:14098763-Alexandrium_andersonii.AAC.1